MPRSGGAANAGDTHLCVRAWRACVLDGCVPLFAQVRAVAIAILIRIRVLVLILIPIRAAAAATEEVSGRLPQRVQRPQRLQVPLPHLPAGYASTVWRLP